MNYIQMTTAELLDHLRAQGTKLVVERSQIRYYGRSEPPAGLVAVLRARKREVISALTQRRVRYHPTCLRIRNYEKPGENSNYVDSPLPNGPDFNYWEHILLAAAEPIPAGLGAMVDAIKVEFPNAELIALYHRDRPARAKAARQLREVRQLEPHRARLLLATYKHAVERLARDPDTSPKAEARAADELRNLAQRAPVTPFGLTCIRRVATSPPHGWSYSTGGPGDLFITTATPTLRAGTKVSTARLRPGRSLLGFDYEYWAKKAGE